MGYSRTFFEAREWIFSSQGGDHDLRRGRALAGRGRIKISLAEISTVGFLFFLMAVIISFQWAIQR